jgi:long-chain acyl-CoA synthetase
MIICWVRSSKIDRTDLGADFDTLLAAAPGDEPDLSIGERDLVMIMYTSGTTSRPKGVMHCNLAVYATVMCNIGEWMVTRDDRILIVLPLFHVSAHCLLTTFLSAGATVVLHNGFDPGRVLPAMEEHKISFFVGLPMMYAAMMEHPVRSKTDVSSLRYCIYAMAPMPGPLLRRLLDEFCPTFVLSSGQTEMYPSTMMLRPEQQLLKEGNYWGEPSIVNDVAIMDDDGTLLPRGQIGEIVHRGPNVMLGYYKDAQATAHSRRFGWHHTGDLGVIDEDGQMLFVDRLKDMIKSGGENVASVKVEQVLLQYPYVQNAAVIGVPHPRWQEAVVAVVISSREVQRRQRKSSTTVAGRLLPMKCRRRSSSSTTCRLPLLPSCGRSNCATASSICSEGDRGNHRQYGNSRQRNVPAEPGGPP